jgi:hypothetical protein
MLDGGATPSVVQKQMRHSSARTTLGIYGHVVGDAQRRAVESHAERIEVGGRQVQLEPTSLQALDFKRRLVGAVGIGAAIFSNAQHSRCAI